MIPLWIYLTTIPIAFGIGFMVCAIFRAGED